MEDLIISDEMASRLRAGAAIRVKDPDGTEVGHIRPRDPLAYEDACRAVKEMGPLSGREVIVYIKAYAKGVFA